MQVDVFSLDGQKNSLKYFEDRKEMDIVVIYEDAAKTDKYRDGSAAFKQMLCDIENSLVIDYILVYKRSRFGGQADILIFLDLHNSLPINTGILEYKETP